MSGIYDHRLLFVLGKGGVGKSTVATAIGLAGSLRGLRTVIVEVSGQDKIRTRSDGTRTGAGLDEVEIASGLHSVSVNPRDAMKEYLRMKAGPAGRLLASTKSFNAVTVAMPGMPEMLTIGKIWELARLERSDRKAQSYDLVVVDAPATGHGIAMLQTPETFAEIARVGPIAQGARTIASVIKDRTITGVVVVASAEELVVDETLRLHDLLVRERLKPDIIILNGMYPNRYSEHDISQLRTLASASKSAPLRRVIRSTISEQHWAFIQGTQRDRIRQDIDIPMVELPYLISDVFGWPEIEILANKLNDILRSIDCQS